MAYVYTLPDCAACGRAKALLAGRGVAYREVPIDNPLVEVGVKMFFKDGQVHAPVVWLPDDGVYVLGTDDPPRLLRVVPLGDGA